MGVRWTELLACVVVVAAVGVVGVACGSKSATPRDGSSSDTSRETARAETAPSEAGASETSSSDAKLMEAGCTPHSPPPDPSLLPDASCSSPDDTDHDGVPDCRDGCPYDATKLAPGACGCNIPDFDSDGDGIPDCLDGCEHDPNNAGIGQCGCVGEVVLAPVGSPCTDPSCPQAGTTCNGAGVCGSRSTCSPCVGGHFVVSPDNRQYWFCMSLPHVIGPQCTTENVAAGPAATRAAAESACAAKGLTLARIQSLDENRFVASFLTAPAWIGANDLQTAGQWYWSSATSDSDTQFWSGGADGGNDGSLFYNWAPGAPGAASCASITLDEGLWSDTDCSRTLGYICN